MMGASSAAGDKCVPNIAFAIQESEHSLRFEGTAVTLRNFDPGSDEDSPNVRLMDFAAAIPSGRDLLILHKSTRVF
jgi:hypothetical protein